VNGTGNTYKTMEPWSFYLHIEIIVWEKIIVYCNLLVSKQNVK
jgi:hypothetical protein